MELSSIEFASRLGDQFLKTRALLSDSPVGSDELSALIACTLKEVLFDRLESTSLNQWIVYQRWFDQRVIEGNMPLRPFSTSMDCRIPGESIVLLAQQHEVPGTGIKRWSALQDKAKVAYLASDPILACRLNAFNSVVAAQSGG